MRFTTAIFLVAVAFVASVTAQSCNDGKGHFGTCKFTKDCQGPEFQSVPNHCPGPTNYQCCIPTGCVICPGDKRGDLEARRPCC
ncbi:hypothetical protein B0H19DRAFT_1270855 [Mycena capillaripes]|nr:hypothetical protein B0H19DRAFT_1270855 [Mycena capillaripes]